MFKHAEMQNTDLAPNKEMSSLIYMKHVIIYINYKLWKTVSVFLPTLYIHWTVPQTIHIYCLPLTQKLTN